MRKLHTSNVQKQLICTGFKASFQLHCSPSISLLCARCQDIIKLCRTTRVSWLCHGCIILAAADMEGVYYHKRIATVPQQYIYAHVHYNIHIHNCTSRLCHSIIIVELWHKYYAVTGCGRIRCAFENMACHLLNTHTMHWLLITSFTSASG